MTKEEILQVFASDESFASTTNLTREHIASLKFSEKSGSKLIEVIKMAIDGVTNGESEGITARKIHTFLNR